MTVQVALISAVMLVGSAAALIAGRTRTSTSGMDTANLYMMGIELPEDRYATVEEQASFYDRLLAELRATPGVDAARVMQESGAAPFAIEGAEYATPSDRPTAWVVVLSESPDADRPDADRGPHVRQQRQRDGSRRPRS